MAVSNVKSTWIEGDLHFRDVSANDIMELDGTNRAMVVPSGSTLTVAGTLGTTGAVTTTGALTGTGAATLQMGESTTGVTTAGGTSLIYGYGYHKTNALTGNLRGVRGNAVVHVASTAGTAEGVFGRGANGKATTDTDGVNLLTARGGSFIVAGVGKATSGPSVLTNAQGAFIQLDIDAANLTVSDARGLYVNVQSGNATANTLTACNLAYLEYESVVGTAPAINSAIKIAGVGGYTAATQLIDASTFSLAGTDTDKVTLLKFKNSAGTITYMRYDTSDNALVFATS